MLSHTMVGAVTPGLHIRNEEYWIHYVLRDILKVFGRAVVIDTGSTDQTTAIVKKTFDMYGTPGECILVEEDMGTDAIKIGQCSTRLRGMIKTPWMLLVDGDEIWRTTQLKNFLDALEGLRVEDTEVGLIKARNIIEHNDVFVEREGFSADRLFSPVVKWSKRNDYPFQSHDLEDRIDRGKSFYFLGDVFFWHVRHIIRSSNEQVAYFRQEKRDYFPWDGQFEDLPEDWLGDVDPAFLNPYLKI